MTHENETHENETHENETHENETHENETHENERPDELAFCLKREETIVEFWRCSGDRVRIVWNGYEGEAFQEVRRLLEEGWR